MCCQLVVEFSVGIRGFRHITESDLFFFHFFFSNLFG